MYRIIHTDKDAYITNKIVGNFRVIDANTGQAGTIDLFKLYDETSVPYELNPIELSRGLVHFDLAPLREMTQTILDINDSSFKCYLKLSDVYGGQTTPSNFTLIVHALSKSFDEGTGKDIARFEDLGPVNFITASVIQNPVFWSTPGADAAGTLGSSNIDIIESGDLGDGLGIVQLYVTQSFPLGTEDLEVDITKLVSGTLAGLIPDCGFRIAYSGSQETDEKTRFVKRFASRNTTNTAKRPKLITVFNDSLSDDHNLLYFNLTGSIFLNNYHRGTPGNFLSGTSATPVVGDNCMFLTLSTGSFTQTFNASQFKIGNNFQTGIYTSSFAISEFDPNLRQDILTSGSITFDEVWGSLDGTVGFYTGSVTVKPTERSSFSQTSERYFVNITNMRADYKSTEKFRFRLFVEDFNSDVVFYKVPYENTGIVVDQCFYRVRDFESDEVIIPFHDPGTKVSNDATTHYFDFFMSSLPKGRTYTFDFKIINKGLEILINDVAAKFRVD